MYKLLFKLILLIIFVLITNVQLYSQTKLNTNIGVVIINPSDTGLIKTNTYNNNNSINDSILIKSGMSSIDLYNNYSKPNQIILLNNNKEVWIYDTTRIYIKNDTIDVIVKTK